VVWPTSMPSLSSSPWIRGAPQNGFAMLMSRIRFAGAVNCFGFAVRTREGRALQTANQFGDILAYLILGGLHHRYARI
jgi:hypothetical protein